MCAALNFFLKFLVYFLEKKITAESAPGCYYLSYQTIILPRQNIQIKFISAQLFWCISEQRAFNVEGRNVSLHVAPDETNCLLTRISEQGLTYTPGQCHRLIHKIVFKI